MSSNEKKTKFLGMPYGTATNRLRKQIMFQLVQETGRDSCFKCNELISTPEEFSIEHKEPWLESDVNLFWDLNNIAFSHLKCNRPDRPWYRTNYVGPEGTAWCGLCKAFLPKENFTKDKSNWDGLEKRCRKCKYGWLES